MPAASVSGPFTHSWIALIRATTAKGLALGFETEPQHRVEGAVKTPHPAPALGATSTVVGHTASHERMRELEQDGRAPAEKKDDLPL
jgi:hypothetical protein